jgi:hypothetical protein
MKNVSLLALPIFLWYQSVYCNAVEVECNGCNTPVAVSTQKPSAANTGIQDAYGQCGGIGWTGPTQCCPGFSCVKGNDYYFQCVPAPTAAVSKAPVAAPVAASTQKPSPAANTGIQNAYGQCGGIGWTGPTQCESGFTCVKGNDYYFQCVPVPTAPVSKAPVAAPVAAVTQAPVAAATQKPSPAANTGVQDAYGQCGGIGWTGPTQCCPGFSCVKGNDYYFQCVPAPTAAVSKAPVAAPVAAVTQAPVAAATQKPSPAANTGVQDAYGQCGGIGWTGPTQCCPGFSCVKGNDYYFQCVPAPTAAVSKAPVAAPVAASTQKPSPAANTGIQNAYGQCGGIGWTGPTQCESGFTCVKGNDYYFQCVPVPTASVTSRPSPAANSGVQCAFGQCGGIGWTGPTKCESGWTCSRCNDHYSQCVPKTHSLRGKSESESDLDEIVV